MHFQGRALVALGRPREGVALLDEAMVAVVAGEVWPPVAGNVYCSMIDACLEMFDLRRAQEWTSALTAWWERQPDLATFTGQCLIHRAEILQLHGAWPEALDAASAPATSWSRRRTGMPPALRFTDRRSCTGSGVSSARQKTHTGRPLRGGTRDSRAGPAVARRRRASGGRTCDQSGGRGDD